MNSYIHPKEIANSKMTCYSLPSSICFSTFFILCFLSTLIKSQVPANETFKIINEGEFGDYIIEYDASYRVIQTDTQSFFAFPFRLCFYNTTPNAFVLAIRAGLPRDEDLMRWVWDANRNRPVKENATLTFGRDGNLVLAEADGRIAWQTNTANKGVIGLNMLPNGNLVLYDKLGKFVWQSFDYPVDTLLVGMSLRRSGGRNKLVSRTSDADGSDGKYSLILDGLGLNLYLNNGGKQLRYNGWRGYSGNIVRFDAVPLLDNSTGYELIWTENTPAPPPLPPSRRLLQSRPVGGGGTLILSKVNYNATISFLRLESNGNIKAYTYYDKVEYLKWSETYAFFSQSPNYGIRECGLPSKCGSYGLCQRGMCVGCPTPKGILGWSETCAPPQLPPCTTAAKGGGKVNYYKIESVEHFLNPAMDDGEGPVKIESCREKCSKDCNCKGFVYKWDTSKCLIAPVLGTLIRDVNTSVAYIKY